MRYFYLILIVFFIGCKDFTINSDQQKVKNNNIVVEKEQMTSEMISVFKFTSDHLKGKTNFASNEHFILVENLYCNKEIYLMKEVYESFIKMYQEAKKENIDLKIISGARSFDHQKSIWERKWKTSTISDEKERALDILKYSSMPMSSRHHWGTDIDLNSLENNYFDAGVGLKTYEWLKKNAQRFGFCQVYSDKLSTNRTGYEMEKWHWSYMPLAEIALETYNNKITYIDFEGFVGAGLVKKLNLIEKYVNGITKCD